MDNLKGPQEPSMDPALMRRTLMPIVQHGLREMQAGVRPDHVLYETAIIAWLVGQGMDARQAIRLVERNEEEWVGVTGDVTGTRAPGYPTRPPAYNVAFGKMQKFPMTKGGFGKGGFGKGLPVPPPAMAPWGMPFPYMVQGMDCECDCYDQSGYER